MHGFLSNTGLWLDSLGGAAQFLLALYILAFIRLAWASAAFALFVGANGLAFLLRNLIPHEHALFPLLGLTVWGSLNWVASAALLILSATWLDTTPRRWLAAFTVSAAIGVTLALLNWASAPPSMNLFVFGGPAVYSVIAYLLVLIALTTRTSDQLAAALLTAVLAINSSLHAGAGLVGRGSIYNFAHLAGLLGLALLWLSRARGERRGAAAVAAVVLGAGLLVGIVAATALGSQAAVQNSGLYGIGRLLAVAVAVLAVNRQRFFWSRQS